MFGNADKFLCLYKHGILSGNISELIDWQEICSHGLSNLIEDYIKWSEI